MVTINHCSLHNLPCNIFFLLEFILNKKKKKEMSESKKKKKKEMSESKKKKKNQISYPRDMMLQWTSPNSESQRLQLLT
ncbi:hypothetical protein VN97_g7287 [Penicillium thymicola]|uniref:Uncharacterized protein n=1 Tax=Penicillium thymicola TaxID=293382 RepID=A0AAI9TET2_PENTH|nr:hypothetical protein VN97_g7287 [Penicillium thymicola]